MALVVTTAALAASVWGATGAAAHEGPGVVVVERGEPTATGHRYLVRLTWQNDGHPAARTTTLTATAFGPDGAPQTPVPMAAVDDDGRFEATLDLPRPGQWRVNFTSVTPTASLDVSADAAPPPVSTEATTPTTAQSTTAAGDDPADAAAATDADETDEADDGNGSGIAVVVALVVVAALAVAAFMRTRRKPAAAADSSGDADVGEGVDEPAPTTSSTDDG